MKTNFHNGGMTHLAVVFVDPDTYQIEQAWLTTSDQARTLKRHETASKYIPVAGMRSCVEKTAIGDILSEASELDILLN